MIRITLDQMRFHLATDVDLQRDFRWIKPENCLTFHIGKTTRFLIDRLSREHLMKVSGIREFDWAYPIDWARATLGERPWPQLVWCYDPTPHNIMHGRSSSLMGYPVFDNDLIAKLGNLFQWHLDNGLYEVVSEEQYT